MSLLYHNDTIIKKEKELLRALLGQFCKLGVVKQRSLFRFVAFLHTAESHL